MSDIFGKHYRKYDAWYDRHKFAFLSELEAIKKVLPQKGRGLEIGVGTGRFATGLGISAGIDPSSRMLKVAKKRGVNVRFGFGEDIPFPDGSFDYAAIIITLCFVKNPRRVLEEVHRALREDGKIIVAIVDKESFLGKFYQKKKSVFYKQAKFFSVKKVTRLLEETGFASFSCYQTVFVSPDKMKSVKRPRRGFGQGGFVVISAKKRAIEKPRNKSVLLRSAGRSRCHESCPDRRHPHAV